MNQQADLIPIPLGEKLELARQARGLSVSEAAAQLRLSQSVISHLENEEWGAIAPVYLRGYLKSYARFLGLDTTEINDALNNILSGSSDPQLQPVFNADNSRGRADSFMKVASYLLVSAVIIPPLLFWYTQRAMDLSYGPEQVDADSVQTEATTRNRIARAIGAETGERSSRNLNASAAPLGLNSEVAEGPEAREVSAAIDDPGAVSFDLTLNADSWVEIHDADGRRLEHDLLRGGITKAYRGVPPVTFLIGRSGAAQLNWDGEPINIREYATGDVASFELGKPDSS